MEPTTPKKQLAAPQAAVLAHWERVGEAVKNEDLALQRFDQRRSGLWEAYGLNDQLVSKLAFKAVVLALTTAAYRGGCGAKWRCRATLHATRCARSSTTGRGGAWLTQSQVWQTGVAADTPGTFGRRLAGVGKWDQKDKIKPHQKTESGTVKKHEKIKERKKKRRPRSVVPPEMAQKHV